MLYIGIDPGVKTGLAWGRGVRYHGIKTLQIHQAMELVAELVTETDSATVVIEDARLRGCAHRSAAKAQGAGSVKRDCRVWQDYLTDDAWFDDCNLSVVYMPPGRCITKLSAMAFRSMTGWQERTSEHARDAAMLIAGLLHPLVRVK